MKYLILLLTVLTLSAEKFDYRVLATTKTSSMEKEMNQAAEEGYIFGGVMGGESAFGGKEVMVVMKKSLDQTSAPKRRYVLLAASKTSTLQKEMQAAGDEGFVYCGQTVFQSTFGGAEVSVILEKTPTEQPQRIEYRLLATSKTSTMEKELKDSGGESFQFLGVIVGKTALGGREVISILQRTPAAK